METTPDEFCGQVTVAAGDIAEALLGHEHRVALAALMRVYLTVAEAAPCCRSKAAAGAFEAGARLISPFADHTGTTH